MVKPGKNQYITSTTAADTWHLKVKDPVYCITTSMQKISPIHQFIPEIEQILESHDLKEHTHI